MSDWLQGFKKRLEIQIIVKAQQVLKSSHPFFLPDSLTSPVRFFGESHLIFQLGKPLFVRRQSREVQLFGCLKPLVGKPQFGELGTVRFHPFFLTGAGADVATDFQKRRHWHVHDPVLFFGQFDITVLGDLGHKMLFLSESNHNARSWNPKLGFENSIGWCVFGAASAEIRFLLECIAACLLGWPRPDTQALLRISGSAL